MPAHNLNQDIPSLFSFPCSQYCWTKLLRKYSIPQSTPADTKLIIRFHAIKESSCNTSNLYQPCHDIPSISVFFSTTAHSGIPQFSLGGYFGLWSYAIKAGRCRRLQACSIRSNSHGVPALDLSLCYYRAGG